MKTPIIILLATAALSLPADAQQPTPAITHTALTQQTAKESVVPGKDRIGLNATQRQMIAWSIAGLGDMQAVPPNFRPALGAKAPKGLALSQVPGAIRAVAPPVANYEYAMLQGKELIFVKPQDGAIVDMIHLNRRL